jgi:RNA polymerase sigma factor for flagellar operon FliA
MEAFFPRRRECIAAMLEVLAELLPAGPWRLLDLGAVAEIARTLRVEQKPLYRRLDGIQSKLRAALESRGVDRMRAIEILQDATAR